MRWRTAGGTIACLAAVAAAVFVSGGGAATAADAPAPTQAKEPPVPALADHGSSIAELVTKLDPARDDWKTEILQDEAGSRLSALAGLLARGGWTPDEMATIAVTEARSTPLRPEGMKRGVLEGDIGVSRFDARATVPASAAPLAGMQMPLASALRALTVVFGRSVAPRFAFKIVGVDWSEGQPLVTDVRYEGSGRASSRPPGRPVQQVADWTVRWSGGTDAEPLRIESVRLVRFEEMDAPAALFTDATATVLPVDAPWYGDLARGGEYWFGRIDAVGELNLLGHQGIAIGDVDGDGLEDLYVAMGTGLPNRLFVREPGGRLRDVAAERGVDWLDDTKGALFADMDNDGDQDLLLAIGPVILLAKNDGHGRFERFASMRAPTASAFYSISVADYDLDGDLDIYATRYVSVAYGQSAPIPMQDANNGPSNHLLRNEGEDRFTDVTVATGLDVNNRRFSLSAAWADYDADGDPDLYVTNDFGRNNLYRNDGGKFTDVAAAAGAEDQAAGMGASWGDYDLDGDLDLYVSNMYSAAGNRVAYQPRFQSGHEDEVRRQVQRYSLGNTLLANRGDGTFRDASEEAGVRMGRWAWGSKFADLNDDGFEDIVVPNGFLTGAVPDDL